MVVLVEGALSTRIHKRAFWKQNVCINFKFFFIVICKGTCWVSWPKKLNKTNEWIKCEIWFHDFNLSNLVLFPRCLRGIPLLLEKCLNHLVSSRNAKTNFHSISSLLYVALMFHLSMDKYLASQLKEKCRFQNHKINKLQKSWETQPRNKNLLV